MLENRFQSELKKDLKKIFPDCMVMKNDPTYLQGVPDLIVLYKNKWAMLECKKCASAKHRPNQNYYVEKLNGMGFSSFIFPENKEEVLSELKKYFN